MLTKCSKIWLSGLIFLSFISVQAQYTNLINSNRPGVSQGAFAVGVNVVQLETGISVVKEERVPQTAYTLEGLGVEFLARYGLLWEQLEIQVEGTYQNDTKTYQTALGFSSNRANFKSLSAGVKYLIFDPYKNPNYDAINLRSYKANHGFKWKHLIPAVSVLAGINYDTKNNPFTYNPYSSNQVEGISPQARLITQNNFKGGWVLVTNILMDRIGTDQSDMHFLVTLTHAINTTWVVFAEAQGIKSDLYADNLFRFGGAYLWNRNFQIDTSVTLNAKDTPKVFTWGVGVSYRLDFHRDKISKNDAQQ
jgi:hypothetical protein